MAKDAENKANLLNHNELDSPQLKNLAQTIAFLPVLEAKMIPQEKSDSSFPVNSFPEPLRELIIQTMDCLSFPADYTGTAMLFSASVAIGNTHRAVIKTGFDVPVVLYCGLVGKPGATKSHPLSLAIKPLAKIEAKLYKAYNEQQERFKTFTEMSTTEKKDAEKVEAPQLRKMLMQDFTPESLQFCHFKNPRGLGACNDELMAWVNNFNRYAKGSAEPFWLSNHSGTFTDNLRSDKYIRIEHCFVSVIGTIQPELLKAFAEGRIHNGFLDRILFAYPLGLKKTKWNRQNLNQDYMQGYEVVLNKLLELEFNGTPKYIHFEKNAEDKLYEWQSDNTDKANDENATRYVPGICNKLDTLTPRIALILQLLHDVCDGKETTQIELDCVNKAIDLIEYYRMGAYRVYAEIFGEGFVDKKKQKEAQKKRAMELLKEGKSLREIAQIVLGDEKKFSTIAHWIQ
jgi:Protein of unknown function (DUF3987)